jgi:acetyltransferase-like isoleucine patch superfamily enzyme
MDNCNVGNNSIIGAGAVVTESVPEFSIAAGIPAKVIKSRK